MALKDDWKKTGKGIGGAFKNFGKAMKTTVKVGLGKEESTNEEGKSSLKEAWSNTGKSFGDAGKSVGKSTSHTAKKATGKDEEKKKASKPDESEVVDVESTEK